MIRSKHCPPEALEHIDSAIDILDNEKSLKVAGLVISRQLPPERQQNYLA